MGNAQFNPKQDPCNELLEKFVACADKHGKKAPSVYGEYCEEEKGLYLLCRENELKKHTNSGDNDAD